MSRRPFIIVVGHEPELEREEGAVSVLRGLGAQVRTLDLWDEPARAFVSEDDEARVILVETPERPDLAVGALRALRREVRLEGVPAIAAVSVAQVARIDPAGGFDDFVLSPYVPAELYARIRKVEWQKSEFATEERVKVGPLLVDRSAREVCLDGRSVPLTAKEFALLSYLCEKRGKVVSREELLRRVWGNDYDGGPRTVDIHVTRLRAKLGVALPLATLRGAGYKLEAPERAVQPARPAEAASVGTSASAAELARRRAEEARATR